CIDCKLTETLNANNLSVIEKSPHPQGKGSLSMSFSPCSFTKETTCQHIVEHIRDITELEELKISLEKKNESLAKTTSVLKKAQQDIRDELRLARLIQQDILPKEAPSVNGLKLAVTYHPITDVGGDIYDFIQFSPDRIGIFIGDASGHGLSAAMVGTISKMSLYYNTKKEMPVNELLDKMNQDLLDNIHTGHYLTCFWGIFDLKNNTFTYSKAGHPAPVLITKEGSIKQLNTVGTFLGLIAGIEFEMSTVSFNNGDRIFLFTDGIYEALDSQTRTDILGYDSFIEILSKCNCLPFNKLLSSIQKQLQDLIYDDDYTLIAIETTPTKNAENSSL
ncbi:MAG: PP2C family protein-serine/threonine phosphatase, partial [Fibrobacter sp.]|nr:PP2C family protein-serine/threonine phosphatase [Fibrobacter sp.]